MPASNQNWEKEEFSIKDLSLWDENARFPEEYFNKKEDELVEYFLKKKEFEIECFAKEVVNEYDLPQLEKIVVLRLNGKLIVLEGNRRLVVYKLLLNPVLIKDQRIKKVFDELKKQINISEHFKLEANVTTSKEEGLRFVDRKHNKGNNEVGWGEHERRNFAVRRLSGKHMDIRRIELAKVVKKLTLPAEIKEAVLGRGYVTTFYRVVDSTSAQRKLGYDVLESGYIKIKNQKTFDDLLKIIVFNILNKVGFNGKGVDSRQLNTKEAIDDYITNLKQKDVGKVDSQTKNQTKNDIYRAVAGIKTTGRSKPLSILRKYLISSSFYIDDNRINDIYYELHKRLVVDNVPNAVAVLFRVFMECSVDYYIKNKKIVASKDIKLAGKINMVVNDLKIKGLAKNKELKKIRRFAQKDSSSILSVNTFHDFVHDYTTSPIPSELKKHWENLEEFFIILWKSLSSERK